jgi:hypothetical protein
MDDSFSSGDIAAVVAEQSATPASDAPPASGTSDGTPAPPASVATTTPPASSAPLESDPASNAGPIPFDRHKAAIENARQKAIEEHQTKWREQYGWAEQIDRQQLEAWSETAREMSADPVAFTQKLIAELQNDPRYAAQLRSHAARVLGQRQQAQQQDTEPQADLQTEDGTPVFSAKRLAEWHQWNTRRQEQAMNERLAPLQQTHEKLQAAEQQAQVKAWGDSFASREVGAIKRLPHYEANKAEIRAALEKMPLPEHPYAQAVQIRDAYLQVVLPKLSQSERSQVLADINAKATATTTSPTRASATTPIPDADRDTADLLREELARVGR